MHRIVNLARKNSLEMINQGCNAGCPVCSSWRVNSGSNLYELLLKSNLLMEPKICEYLALFPRKKNMRTDHSSGIAAVFSLIIPGPASFTTVHSGEGYSG